MAVAEATPEIVEKTKQELIPVITAEVTAEITPIITAQVTAEITPEIVKAARGALLAELLDKTNPEFYVGIDYVNTGCYCVYLKTKNGHPGGYDDRVYGITSRAEAIEMAKKSWGLK
jgi:hypothetical protein